MSGEKIRWSREKVLELFENNNIRNITDFQKRFSGACNFSYRHNIIDELPFTSRGTPKTKTNKSNKLTLKPLLVEYFKRWSQSEGTTVEQQAKKYSYHRQYVEYCNENELDLKTGEKIKKIQIKNK